MESIIKHELHYSALECGAEDFCASVAFFSFLNSLYNQTLGCFRADLDCLPGGVDPIKGSRKKLELFGSPYSTLFDLLPHLQNKNKASFTSGYDFKVNVSL